MKIQNCARGFAGLRILWSTTLFYMSVCDSMLNLPAYEDLLDCRKHQKVKIKT